jgi:hypothetical protein
MASAQNRGIMKTIPDKAWIDCLIQACAATPWIIVTAIGRLLWPGHS